MPKVHTKKENSFLFITIDNPPANAISLEVLQGLAEVFKEVYEDESIKGIVLRGKGEKFFAAGADIEEFQHLNVQEAKERSVYAQNIFSLIEDCPKPVIAAINGYALGGGCELAMATHLRIAASHANFGQPEVKLGLIAGFGGTQRLTALIGKGRALEMLLNAKMYNAHYAVEIGLVNETVELEDLDKVAIKMLESVTAYAPLAIEETIRAVNKGVRENLDEGYLYEQNSFGKLFDSNDAKEGINAFLEKREANFTGE